MTAEQVEAMPYDARQKVKMVREDAGTSSERACPGALLSFLGLFVYWAAPDTNGWWYGRTGGTCARARLRACVFVMFSRRRCVCWWWGFRHVQDGGGPETPGSQRLGATWRCAGKQATHGGTDVHAIEHRAVPQNCNPYEGSWGIQCASQQYTLCIGCISPAPLSRWVNDQDVRCWLVHMV